MGPVGIITEQGDLGLGYNPLSEKDQKVLREAEEKEDKKEKK